MGNDLCLRFGYLGVLRVTARFCWCFQSCLRNNGQNRDPPWGLQDFSRMPERHALILKQSFLSVPMDRRDVLKCLFSIVH